MFKLSPFDTLRTSTAIRDQYNNYCNSLYDNNNKRNDSIAINYKKKKIVFINIIIGCRIRMVL